MKRFRPQTNSNKEVTHGMMTLSVIRRDLVDRDGWERSRWRNIKLSGENKKRKKRKRERKGKGKRERREKEKKNERKEDPRRSPAFLTFRIHN